MLVRRVRLHNARVWIEPFAAAGGCPFPHVPGAVEIFRHVIAETRRTVHAVPASTHDRGGRWRRCRLGKVRPAAPPHYPRVRLPDAGMRIGPSRAAEGMTFSLTPSRRRGLMVLLQPRCVARPTPALRPRAAAVLPKLLPALALMPPDCSSATVAARPDGRCRCGRVRCQRRGPGFIPEARAVGYLLCPRSDVRVQQTAVKAGEEPCDRIAVAARLA